MTKSKYAAAGVNIAKGNEAVHRIKEMVAKIGVNEIGKFGGFFPLEMKWKEPVLVSSADGVGTKLKIAFKTGIHNTVGHDLVNHCVNDILVYGARPLFFLDYIAAGVVKPDVIAAIVSGILNGCMENGFVLLGGETAEMPGFYQQDEYDVAGFIVGMVEKKKVIDGHSIQKGDLLIGLLSSGLHTNGYSLARHILFEQLKLDVDSQPDGFDRCLGMELLEIHRSYLRPVSALLEYDLIKGMAHITGGGLLENIPRVLPDAISVQIQKSWPIPRLFSFLMEQGRVTQKECFRVFNMGIGMVVVIDAQQLSRAEKILNALAEPYYIIGQAVENKGKFRVRIQ